MTLKQWTVAAACLLTLLIGHEAYSQEAAANASQGQVQGQSQVGGMADAYANQGQSQVMQGNSSHGGAGGSVSNSGNVTFKDSFNGAEPIRYLPVPSVMPIENYQPAIFGRLPYEDKGPDFISMRQLVHAMNHVDLNAEVAGEKRIRVTTQMLRPLPAGHPKAKDKPKAKSSKELREKMKVKFEINDGKAVNDGFMPIAVLSVETEKPDKSNSASLALKIGKLAKHMKANTVVFLTEGSTKEVVSSGWGIGFSYNYASVGSKPSDSGQVGSGGFGYSQGKASYDNLIYLTAIVGVRKDG